jgi:NADPH-dependent 2,4-dienoyl-CoA reductase/sulfur reductase-like enzyme
MADAGVVIVGAGQAGGRCAEGLRAAGFTGPVTIIGEEGWPPYERPPLSKELLAGKIAVEKTFTRPEAWYAEQNVNLRKGTRVVAIDRVAKTLRLADGQEVPYATLVLATGARARKLPAPGAHLPGVMYVRDIADCFALKERLAPGHRLAVVGAGFIGLEVAATAREAGCAVTVIEIAAKPMARVTAPELGRHYLNVHRSKGVEVLTETAVQNIEAAAGALVLSLSNRPPVAVDTVVVGIGIQPNVELAADAGLAVDNGIMVDEFGRTGDADIYAIGDCAAFLHPSLGRRLRLEAWLHAQNQAGAVAKNIVGQPAPYDELPWAWSDQYGINLQIAGAPESYDSLVWRGDPASGKAILFYLAGGRLVAANAIDMARDMRFVRQIISAAKPVDAAELADPNVKLQDLAKR